MNADLAALFEALKVGPRNLTTYIIATAIRDGHKDEAERQYSWDGDKIASVYQPHVEKLLGCRLHFTHNCSREFCKKVAPKKHSV